MRYCRRLALILCALMLSTGSATVMGQERDLRFGFTPVLSASEMRAEFEPLMTYLSEAIGRKVTGCCISYPATALARHILILMKSPEFPQESVKLAGCIPAIFGAFQILESGKEKTDEQPSREDLADDGR